MAVLAVARENAKQLCEQSIWEAAALEADFLNFGAAYLNRYPDEIPRYADTWGEELKKIQVNLEIKGDIRYLNPEKKDYIWE